MAILEKKYGDRIKITHPLPNGVEVLKIAMKEYALVEKSMERSHAIGLRHARKEKVLGRALYIKGERYDLSSHLLTLLLEAGMRRLIPTIKDKYIGMAVKSKTDQDYITCLERCMVDGKEFKGLEVDTIAQARYLFECFRGNKAVDKAEFDRLKGVKHLLEKDLTTRKPQYSTTENGQHSQYSTTEKSSSKNIPASGVAVKSHKLPLEDKNRVENSQYSTTENSEPAQYSTTGFFESQVLEKLDFICSNMVGNHNDLRGDIKGLTSAINRLAEAFLNSGVGDKALDNEVVVAKKSGRSPLDVIHQATVKGSIELPDKFDNRIYLNGEGEEFLLRALTRVQELLDSGMKKSPTYRKVLEEINTDPEFSRLHEEFVRGRPNKQPVTYYNLEDYYTKRYSIVEIKGKDGVSRKGVVRNQI